LRRQGPLQEIELQQLIEQKRLAANTERHAEIEQQREKIRVQGLLIDEYRQALLAEMASIEEFRCQRRIEQEREAEQRQGLWYQQDEQYRQDRQRRDEAGIQAYLRHEAKRL
jgi:hypothetical protein